MGELGPRLGAGRSRFIAAWIYDDAPVSRLRLGLLVVLLLCAVAVAQPDGAPFGAALLAHGYIDLGWELLLDQARDVRNDAPTRVAAARAAQNWACWRMVRGERSHLAAWCTAMERCHAGLDAADPGAAHELALLRAHALQLQAAASWSDAQAVGSTPAHAGASRRTAEEAMLSSRLLLQRVLGGVRHAAASSTPREWRLRNAAELRLFQGEVHAVESSMVCARVVSELNTEIEEFVLRLGETSPEALLAALRGYVLLARLALVEGQVDIAAGLSDEVLGRLVLSVATESAVLSLAESALLVQLRVRLAAGPTEALVACVERIDALLLLSVGPLRGELLLQSADALLQLDDKPTALQRLVLALSYDDVCLRAAQRLIPHASRAAMPGDALRAFAANALQWSEAREQAIELIAQVRGSTLPALERERWSVVLAELCAAAGDRWRAQEYALEGAQLALARDIESACRLVAFAAAQGTPLAASSRERLQALLRVTHGEAVAAPTPSVAPDRALDLLVKRCDEALAGVDMSLAEARVEQLAHSAAPLVVLSAARERLARKLLHLWDASVRATETQAAERSTLRRCLAAALTLSEESDLWSGAVRLEEACAEPAAALALARRARTQGVGENRSLDLAALRCTVMLAMDADRALRVGEARGLWEEAIERAVRVFPEHNHTGVGALDTPSLRALALAAGGHLLWLPSGAQHIIAGANYRRAGELWARVLLAADPDSPASWEARFHILLAQWALLRGGHGEREDFRQALRRVSLLSAGKFDDGPWAASFQWLERQQS